ncbi:MAG TPA: hypothetical protein VE912_16630 [Bacteroidales bacterium]|nr:hypothetical protein [Bacteroidales bacterium]
MLPGVEVSKDLVFKTDAGSPVNYTNSGATDENGHSILELKVDGINGSVLAYDSVFFSEDDEHADTTLFMCTGELETHSYSVKTRHLVLVPVNGADQISGSPHWRGHPRPCLPCPQIKV